MKNKSIFVKSFIFITSFLFVIFLSCTQIKALYYDKDAHTFDYQVKRDEDRLDLQIKYQNGIKNVAVYICLNNSTISNESCATQGKTTYIDGSEYRDKWLINSSEEIATYNLSFTGRPFAGTNLANYDDGDDKYKIVVKADFCQVRNNDNTDCLKWDSQGVYLDDEFVLDRSFTSSAQVNKTIKQILDILNNIGMPIIWILLGVLLIVRGILLGIDIVKSSDDADLRKKKISGLVWLFIGVGIGYVISISASVIMGMFGYGGFL